MQIFGYGSFVENVRMGVKGWREHTFEGFFFDILTRAREILRDKASKWQLKLSTNIKVRQKDLILQVAYWMAEKPLSLNRGQKAGRR